MEAGGAQAQPEAQTEEFEADEASVTPGKCDRRESAKVLYGTGGLKPAAVKGSDLKRAEHAGK